MSKHHSENNKAEENRNQDTSTALVPVSNQSALPVCRNYFHSHKNHGIFSVEAGEEPEPEIPSSENHSTSSRSCHHQPQERVSSFSENHNTASRPRRSRKRLSREQRRRLFGRFLKGSAAVALVLVLLAGITVACLILTAPDLDSINVSPTESATYIYDQDGNQLRKLTLTSSNRDIVSLEDIPLSLRHAVIAIEDERFYTHGGIDVRGIARAFWSGIKNGSFSEGASTITQQLIKNSVFTEWTQENSFFDRFSRKVQEQYLALQLEDTMSKEEILENYLNTINLGSGCYGVQAASKRYFGKTVSDLTLSESAVLAAIPQNPTALNPITSPEKNNRRRETVLSYMEAQGYITPEEKTAALNDNVYDRIREYDASYEETDIYSYYEDALIDQVLEVLTEEKGYSYDQAYRAVYSGGLRIISAQDPAIQAICDEEFMNAANFPAETKYGIDYALSIADSYGLVTHYGQEDLRSFVRQNYDSSFELMCQDPATAQTYADAFREWILDSYRQKESGSSDSPDNKNSSSDSDSSGSSAPALPVDDAGAVSAPEILTERLTLSPQPQASVVIIDQSTGFVKAVVGSRGEKTASLTLNRATETTRQPGSTFKILTAYAPAIDACGQTLATLYDNEPYQYQDGTPVSNWDLSDYSGPTTIRDSIIRSINVVAVKCITEISPQLGYQYALRFGISTLHERYEANGNYSSDLVQPLALGGITQGVTNLELCGAYAAIAGGGIYRKPKFFTQIYDRHGNLVADYTGQQSGHTDSADPSDISGISSDTDPADGTRILKDSTAYLLTDAMEDVVADENGTAYGSISAGNCPVAGKTGTTSNYKDIWFAGYTPYYTCCVWGGYDNNENLPDSSTYHSYNKTLWSSIMTRIHASLPDASFDKPENISTVTLCRQSHLPAVPGGCPQTYEEVFESGTEPVEECPLHEPIPETEPTVIYQDFLDELFQQTESESESETTSESLSESDEEKDFPIQSETTADSETSPETGFPDQAESSPGSEFPGQTESNPESGFPDQTNSDSSSESPGQTESSPSSDSPIQTDSGSGIPDQTESAQNSETVPNDNPAPQSLSQSEAGQPQTSSLDDMISQLNKFSLR